ncbi:MAG: thiamine phosphate synthase [Planctomycetaceae bacterium]|nr:thiamine phosphate synthase [Planctomycetaceae bacterium]
MLPQGNRDSLTPAARRILTACRTSAVLARSDAEPQWAGHLVLALLQDESLAAASLNRLGVTLDWLLAGGLGDDIAQAARRSTAESPSGDQPPDEKETSHPIRSIDDPPAFTRILDRAIAIARRQQTEDGVTSSHLLLAMCEVADTLMEQLQQRGADAIAIRRELGFRNDLSPEVLAVDFTLALPAEQSDRSGESTSSTLSPALPPDAARNESLTASPHPDHEIGRVLRIVDATLNRAREGLRVLEDYARFVKDDADCARQLKRLRHSLVDAERLLPTTGLQQRSTQTDVGTTITEGREACRESVNDVVRANSRRVQESLRTLEEFGKLINPDFAAAIKQLRYRSYEAEQRLLMTISQDSHSPRDASAAPASSAGEARREILQQSQLYLLLTESECLLPWEEYLERILDAGIDVLQLREKHLNDAELLRRARRIAAACRNCGTLFIMNDRPDLAVLSAADGVHVGQEELSAADVRRIVGPDLLVGIYTHDMLQAETAVAAGADWLGVGPVFSTQTKQFTEYAGLDFVRAAARQISLPWFAIGGIQPARLPELAAAGARRIALTAAISRSPDPAAVIQSLRSALAEK